MQAEPSQARTASTDEIVERLLTVESDPIGCGLANNSYRNPDGPDAADRIQSLTATIDELRTALEEAASVFEEYGRLHRAKGTPEAYAKAKSNELKAAGIQNVLRRTALSNLKGSSS